MSTAPLIQETTFETGDPDAARDFLADAFGHQSLRVNQPIVDDRLLSIRRLAAPSVNVNVVSAPAEMEMRIAGFDDELVVTTFHEGTAAIDHRGSHSEGTKQYGPGDVAIVNEPGADWKHYAKPHAVTSVGISERLLRTVGGLGASDAEIHWEMSSTDPIPGRADLWRRTSGMLERMLTDPELAAAPLVIGPLERVAAATVLTVFPNTLDPDNERFRERDSHSETLRRAKAFIDSHPKTDISAGDLANAAHASPRGVQLAFRRHLDTTPMAYLRSVRLHHAREELRAANYADGDRVASIAAEWGFASVSRFAAYYKRQYGELPSNTLRGD